MRSPPILKVLAFGLLVSSCKIGSALLPTLAWAADSSEGDIWFQARLRNEYVDQDNGLDSANAATLRSVAGFETPTYSGWRFLAEAENVLAVDDRYNSTTNGEVDYSVVADPQDTELNRVLVSYSGLPDTQIKIGRQRLILDNARFVGNVGWRQNEQTFDALMVRNQSLPDTLVHVAYIDKVRRIFGPDSPMGRTNMSSPIVNVKYSGFENWQVSGYGYFLEFDDMPENSNKTIGMRITGTKDIGRARLSLLLEAADQSPYKDGLNNIDARYIHARLSNNFGAFAAGFGVELLSGDGSYGFQTPLATLHAFNGWTDQFLNTPSDGLVDRYLTLSGKLNGIALKATYHDFGSDEDSLDYGREIDFVANRKINDRWSLGFKLADFQADQRGTDTRKIWLYAQFSY